MTAIVALFMLSHSFYAPECCHDQDCHPYPGEMVTMEPQGYRLADGRFMNYYRTRPSPDDRYHLCDRPGRTAVRELTCFYAPRPSS
jgi:hypothetical protein